MTFEKLVDSGDEKFAAISVKRMELEGTMLESGTLVRFKVGGSGMVHRSLSSFIDTRLSFAGTMVMDEEILIEGKKVKMNIVGPFKAAGGQQLIKE
ncbi:MAG: hypothetical protein C4531_01665 [Desulfurivibrio sp.]|nr:MAG: hypothetical protein C4531_01665 [Desulfurivibrio sp.]